MRCIKKAYTVATVPSTLGTAMGVSVVSGIRLNFGGINYCRKLLNSTEMPDFFQVRLLALPESCFISVLSVLLIMKISTSVRVAMEVVLRHAATLMASFQCSCGTGFNLAANSLDCIGKNPSCQPPKIRKRIVAKSIFSVKNS